jgi:hypothetical protein
MDWNWFFSAVAQSAAALVAIFAGFIATKIITNQSEFKRNRDRMHELVLQADELVEVFRNRRLDRLNKYMLASRLPIWKGAF